MVLPKRLISILLAAVLVFTSCFCVTFITLADTTLDPAFEALLDAQGFPESYRPMLRELHKKYPNWKFETLKTGLDWNTVVASEYILHDSLIDKTTTAAWKSYDSGRYNFSTGSFVTFDGGAYHAASKEYLSYCLDPRNFLTDTNVLMFLVAYGQSGETVSGISNILSGLNWAKNYPSNDEVVYIYEDGTYDIIIGSKPPETQEPTEPETDGFNATVNSIEGPLNVRATASTSANILGQLYAGNRINVIGEENGTAVSGNSKWYKITYNGGNGYVHSSYITLDPAKTSEVAETASSTSSIVSSTTSSDTSSLESTSSESSSSNTSSGETSSGETSSDSTSSNPTPDEPEVFVPTKPVKEKIEIDSYSKAFYAAHKITGISAYMLASRIRQEQGLNGNPSGKGEVAGYEGYYNLWNIKTVGNNKYVDGAKYAKEQGWDTPLKGIVGGSEWLDTNYFKTGQDTLYLQKYDVVAGGNGYYWHEYMTYLPAPWQEASILKKAFTNETIQNEAVFKIPIYNNMPASAVACPNSSGTNNNYLKSISVAGNEISNFTVYTHTYTDIVIDYSESVAVEATAYDSGALVSGAGDLTFIEGVNTVNLVVTASNGAKRTYTLKVTMKEKPPEPVEPDPDNPDPDNPDGPTPDEPILPSIDTTDYTIGDFASGVEPGTTVEEFVQNLAVSNGSVKLFGSDNAEKEPTAVVATGDKFTIYDLEENEYISYYIVIYGDVNGDGAVNSLDLLRAQKHIVGIITMSNLQIFAADSNKDSSLNSVDLLRTQKYIVGIIDSIQGE